MLYMTHAARVPKLHATTVAGFVQLSEKSWTYLLAGQLLLCDGWDSMCVALVGLAVGYMYNQDESRLQKMRLPAKAEELWVKLHSGTGVLTSFLSGPAGNNAQAGRGAPAAAARGENLIGGGGGGGGMFAHPAAQQQHHAAAAVPPPDEESIVSLTSMGFDRAAVLRALQQTGNNVEAAANILLR